MKPGMRNTAQVMTKRNAYILFTKIFAVFILGYSVFFAVQLPVVKRTYARLPFSLPGIPACPGCNVVVLSLDVLRADALPCYGYHRNTTPNLCAYAAKNALFTRAYSESSYTMDTVFSMFTGLLPSAHGMLVPFRDRLHPDIKTLTQQFKQAGYTTIFAGKTDDMHLPLDKGLGRGFDTVRSVDTRTPGEMQRYYTQLLSVLDSGPPTFVYLHNYALHDPYLVGNGPRLFARDDIDYGLALTTEGFEVNTFPFYAFVIAQYERSMRSEESAVSTLRNRDIYRRFVAAMQASDLEALRSVFAFLYPYEQFELYDMWYLTRINRFDEREIAYLRALYDERLFYLDEELKPLLEYLSRPDVRQKTIVVITSPHGEEFMEHGELVHDYNIYNTVTHVPLIVASPHIVSGVYSSLAQLVDVFPTVLGLAGVRAPETAHGVSLEPVLRGITDTARDFVIGEHRGGKIRSVYDGRWKLYVNVADKMNVWYELFDVVADPLEKTNVIAAHPEELRRLFIELKRFDSTHKNPAFEDPFPDWIDEDSRNELIKRGYF